MGYASSTSFKIGKKRKDKDYQEFFAGIKELAKGLMQIRERAAIEYAPLTSSLKNAHFVID